MQNNLIRELLKIKLDSDFLFQFLTDPADYTYDPPAGSDMAYIVQKSEKLIEFGVEGIAWILTESRKIPLLRSNRRRELFEWTDEVPLFGEYSCCLQTILEEEDILPPS